MERIELERGDYIRVGWIDIFEDPTGNPDKPQVARRFSLGQFWAYMDVHGHPCLVTTTTEDDLTHDSGYCCYPIGCVVSIEVIKRKRRKKKNVKKPDSEPAVSGPFPPGTK